VAVEAEHWWRATERTLRSRRCRWSRQRRGGHIRRSGALLFNCAGVGGRRGKATLRIGLEESQHILQMRRPLAHTPQHRLRVGADEG